MRGANLRVPTLQLLHERSTLFPFGVRSASTECLRSSGELYARLTIHRFTETFAVDATDSKAYDDVLVYLSLAWREGVEDVCKVRDAVLSPADSCLQGTGLGVEAHAPHIPGGAISCLELPPFGEADADVQSDHVGEKRELFERRAGCSSLNATDPPLRHAADFFHLSLGYSMGASTTGQHVPNSLAVAGGEQCLGRGVVHVLQRAIAEGVTTRPISPES